MGFFDFFKKKTEPAKEETPAASSVTFPAVLGAEANGKVIDMENIPDEVFKLGVLGYCCAIDPVEGKVFAPIDGEITQAPDSGHALGIQAGEIEVLIHVGVDTVDMKGDGFDQKVKVGDKVKKGQLVLEMDLAKIAAAKHPACIITVVTNTDDFGSVTLVPAAGSNIEIGADLLKVSK